jgi:hypothetical protein
MLGSRCIGASCGVQHAKWEYEIGLFLLISCFFFFLLLLSSSPPLFSFFYYLFVVYFAGDGIKHVYRHYPSLSRLDWLFCSFVFLTIFFLLLLVLRLFYST